MAIYKSIIIIIIIIIIIDSCVVTVDFWVHILSTSESVLSTR